ncbi:MAG: DUF616 domain-containing protein [Bacteroidales bacterium]|nr:DUF616 domain-containing protein [Bacteroidales bacterium]
MMLKRYFEVRRKKEQILISGLFYKDWYLYQNPDVANSGIDPVLHYIYHGAIEERDPNPFFDTTWYLNHTLHPTDQTNPLLNYIESGRHQGLDTSPFFQYSWFVKLFQKEIIGNQNFGLTSVLSKSFNPFGYLKGSSPNVAVYTAIFGEYDDPPRVLNPDPKIKYILFTDNQNVIAPQPWEIRILPRIFNDPQLDARRVKIMTHLFLPDIDISVWIDANIDLKYLRYTDVIRIGDFTCIALPPHENRDCIYEESKPVIELDLDSPVRVQRQMDYYRFTGFPEKYGLHATMILFRRHLQPECRKFCSLWWDQVSNNSKRDQLSFDFVRWITKTEILTLPFKYTDNEVFEWGKNKLGGHKIFYHITNEHTEHNVQIEDIPFNFLAAPYNSQQEMWTPQFLINLQELNKVVSETEEELEGNLCYFHLSKNYSFAPPDPRRWIRREHFIRALTNRKCIFEIGFNAGHSALLALHHTNISFTSIDIAIHQYVQPAADFLKVKYGDRFCFYKLDSRELYSHREKINFKNYDLFHIDGGHDTKVYTNDILTVLHLAKTGVLVIIDDIYVSGISEVTNKLIKKGFIEPYGNLGSIESNVFVVKKIFPVIDEREFRNFINKISETN